jgi:hypothetical protein
MRMTINLLEPVQAHKALTQMVWPMVKSCLMAGRRLVLEVKPEKRTIRQNKRYWGRGVLAQIAEQAAVDGRKFSAEVWHEQFKRWFIGVIEMPDGSVQGKSSTELSKREFCDFCTEVEAYAVMHLGVRFVDLEPNE